MKHGLFALLLFVLVLTGAACSDDDTNTADQLPDLGKSWTRVAMPSSFTNRTRPGVAVLNGRLYVAAGNFTTSNGDDCWSTPNGTTWINETNDIGITGLRDFAMTSHDGKLWIHSGVNGTGSQQWFTRSSADGKAWTGHAIDHVRYHHAMASYNNRLWVFGGLLNGVLTNNVSWSSTGSDWTNAPNPGFARRALPGVAVHAGKLWVVGGYLTDLNTDSLTNDVWSSTDGVTWTCVTPAAPFCPRGAIGLVTAGNRLYAIGGAFFDQYGNRIGTNDIWKSYDGVTWEQVPVTTPYPVRTWNAAASFNDGLYVIAGETENGSMTNDIWYSK